MRLQPAKTTIYKEDTMSQNKYDDDTFFEKYAQMERSQKGLAGAGEWPTLKKMLPDFHGQKVLDLGCGYGWLSQYALAQGASKVVGIDISEKMLDKAREMIVSDKFSAQKCAIEDIDFLPQSFDIVISSLAFHYIKDFEATCAKINKILVPNGRFIFSAEHPVFTAKGEQKWFCGENGRKLHWPVDNYFNEGEREASFLGEAVTKYHRTITSYVSALLRNGFEINALQEPQPTEEMLEQNPEMADELRRPMMIIISSTKK